MKFAFSLPVLALSFLLGRAQAQEQLRGLNQDEASESAASMERKLNNKCLTFAGNKRPDGWLCDKGRCYVNDHCVNGVCEGEWRCPYDAQCQEPRECYAPSGTCYNPTPGGRALLERELNDQAPINKPDGTPCDDGNPNSEDDHCVDGVCYGTEPVCTGEFNCFGPSIQPIYCSNPSAPTACGCATSTEGKKVCYQHGSCASFANCATSSDCPSGTKCIPNTCCGVKKCLSPCPAANSRNLEDIPVNVDGECVPSTMELCP